MNDDGFLIAAVCGMPGSGKGLIADTAARLDIPFLSMGDTVRSWFAMERPGEEEINIGEYASGERMSRGDDIWAIRTIARVNEVMEAEFILIDGLRSRVERDRFTAEWGPRFKVIAVHSSPGVRFNRLKKRKRGDDPADRNTFEERDLRELSWGLGDVISLADIMLVNEGEPGSFSKRAEETLRSLKEEA